MARKIQDVVSKKKSMASVFPLTSKKRTQEDVYEVPVRIDKSRVRASQDIDDSIEQFKKVQEKEGKKRIKKSSGSFKKWICIVCIVVGLFFGFQFLSAKLSEVLLTVTLRQVLGSHLDADFVASKTAKAGSTEIPFSVMTLEQDFSSTTPYTGEEIASDFATGSVILYNNYSSVAQKLVKGSQLQTPKGLIFKTNASVTIPGRSTARGTTTPGQVLVAITAAKSGQEYNVGLTDFTILGFKGTAKYKAFYGRGKTPIKGGFVGKRKIASPTSISKVKTEIQNQALASFLKDSLVKKPPLFSLIPQAYDISFTALPLENTSDGVKVAVRALWNGVLFDTASLHSQILKKLNSNGTVQTVSISNLEKAVFLARTKVPVGKKLTDLSSLAFNLKATPDIVWMYDKEKLRADLLGKSRAELKNILLNYTGIDRVEIKMSPFWIRTLPTDPKKIEIQ